MKQHRAKSNTDTGIPASDCKPAQKICWNRRATSSGHPLWLTCLAILSLSLLPLTSSSGDPPQVRQVIAHPGEDLMKMVADSPPGTQFRIPAGTYRLQSISPKDDDSFIGEPGAIMDGAQQLTQFSQSGRLWVARVPLTEGTEYRGVCVSIHPDCMFPSDLFVNDAPLVRVANLEDVIPGKWYLDSAAHVAYLGEDPTGHTVEISVKPFAIRGDAANVRVEGLTIEKYASAAGNGAVQREGGVRAPQPELGDPE